MNIHSFFLRKAPSTHGTRDPIDAVAESLDPSARPGFRWICGYAKAKVRVDPMYRTALTQISPGEKVVDLGCGVGLVGLLLQARGGNNETYGIEWDPTKARFAQDLAKGTPTIQVVCGDFLREAWPACSVIAALDVLHYLTLAQQRDLILRIGAHLPEEGRLILRVMDRAETGIARVTRLCERVAVWIGWNKALRASWRPLEEIHQDMEAAGLSVLSPIGSQGLGIGNHLLVGVKR